MAKSTHVSRARKSSTFRAAQMRIRAFANSVGAELAPNVAVQIGEEIMTDIKASRPGRGVPRDTGALAGTGRVVKAGKTVRLTFGGAAAPYAMIVHERMDTAHPVGEPRYLIRGIQRWQPLGSSAMKALQEQADALVRRASRR